MDVTDRETRQYLDPLLRILRAVRVLHESGLQGVRISAGLSASGAYYRMFILPKEMCLEDDGITPVWHRNPEISPFDNDLVLPHSDSWEDRPFGWEPNESSSVERLVDSIRRRMPRLIETAEQDDPEYVHWFSRVLALAEAGALPTAFSDYHCVVGEVRLVHRGTLERPFAIELPPPGGAKGYEKTPTDRINALRMELDPKVRSIVEQVWIGRESIVCWPKDDLLFWPS